MGAVRALDVERVEHACPNPADVDLAGGDILHDLLLSVRGEVPPFIHGLDAEVAAGELLDPLDEVFNGGREVDLAIGVGQSQHDRLARAAGLVVAGTATAAARRGKRHDCGENESREPASISHPVHGLTPFSDDRDHAMDGQSPGTSWLARKQDCGQHQCARRERCHNRAVARVRVRPANLARLAAGAVALASGLAAALAVLAGLALVAAGLVTSFTRPAGRIGDLALLAGLFWFAPFWAGWKGGP